MPAGTCLAGIEKTVNDTAVPSRGGGRATCICRGAQGGRWHLHSCGHAHPRACPNTRGTHDIKSPTQISGREGIFWAVCVCVRACVRACVLVVVVVVVVVVRWVGGGGPLQFSQHTCWPHPSGGLLHCSRRQQDGGDVQGKRHGAQLQRDEPPLLHPEPAADRAP